MGSIVWTLENFVNTILDVVVIKTGIVISEDYLLELLNEKFPEDKIFENFSERREHFVRIRSEDYESYCWEIRKKLGELDSDIKPFAIGNMKSMLNWLEKGYDPSRVIRKLVDFGIALHDKENPRKIDPALIINRAIKEEIAPIPLILEMMEYLIQSQSVSNTIFPAEQIDWDGGIELIELFERESLPKKSSDFIEQRFINYLQANPEKLEYMHWRNFERLTAEFFKRENYEVKLGPGSKDGGVDLRIFDKKNNERPLIIVQCKRHKLSNEVKVETVKSFYTDVEFEGAKKGLIATTSRVAPGGKNIATLRKYPLYFAENEEIKKWVEEMKVRNYN